MTNNPYTLDEKTFSDESHRKPSHLRRLLMVVILTCLGFAGYCFRDALTALFQRTAASDGTAAQTAPIGGRGFARGARGGGANTIAVLAVAARKTDLAVYLHGLGSVTPSSTVTVRSRVDGQLINVAFNEGEPVQQGALLAEIDPKPFQLQLAQAQAQFDQAKGSLQRDMALLEEGTAEYIRDQELLGKGVIPKQQLDIQSAAVDGYEGSIQTDHAAMENAQAAIANANLQITYTKITAPISGRIGLRLVDAGNIVRAADPNGLAVIAQLQPITVLFNIPEDSLSAVLRKLQAGATLHVDAYDRDDQTKLAAGTLLTVDNQIDASTGTSKLKAVFDNQDKALFPNQFVNVHLLLDVERNATVIPAAAVQRGPQGTYVYVVGSDQRAQIRPITLKDTEGADVAVGSELRPGEMVMIEGMDKVQDGQRVDLQSAEGSLTIDDSSSTAAPPQHGVQPNHEGEPGPERGRRGRRS